jgi:hypothetical protein
MDPEMEFRYRKLDALDTKCGALLTLTSVMLVVVSLPLFAQPPVNPWINRLYVLAYLLFLISAAISVYILWFKEFPSNNFVRYRICLHNVTALMTGTGVLGTLAAVFLRLVEG